MSSPSIPAAATSQDVTLPVIPELYDPNFLDVLLPPVELPGKKTAGPEPTNPLMDALRATANQTFTDNHANAYSSTMSPTLDAFQNLTRHTYGREIDEHLANAWDEDPELTLRIIWNLRSIHDGKAEKEAFYRCFAWLYNNHPRTAIKNLHLLVDPVCVRPKTSLGSAHGCWKDLLNILALAALDQLSASETNPTFLHQPRSPFTYSRLKRYKTSTGMDPDTRIKLSLLRDADVSTEAKQKRAAAAVKLHQGLLGKLAEPKFRALYVAVARLFSERLVQDLRVLKDIDALPSGADRVPLFKQLSLAAKWAPTPGASHDRHTNISTAIAQLLHHAQITSPLSISSPLTSSLSLLETHTLRSFYQRWVLTPLRKATLVPEPLMSANRWSEIKYSRVSSICMKVNMEWFAKRDTERFSSYLRSVEKGTRKISGATLMPHEILAEAMKLEYGDKFSSKPHLQELKKKLAETKIRVVESQWKTLVERLRESGKLDNSLAICDVSGSMGSLYLVPRGHHHVSPIYPAISLSLLLAQLASPPFENGFITFSHSPQFVQLDPAKRLADTVTDMVRSDWSMNTDLDAVFLKLLLPIAVRNNVKQEDMVKRLFIFSDMQFDESRGMVDDPSQWETTHDVIEKAYAEAGYEIPQIVYWNLSGSARTTVPVTGERKGVALMSGFSPGLLKVFMGEDEEAPEEWEEVTADGSRTVVEDKNDDFTPIKMMRKAVEKKSFDGLTVFD